MATIYDVARSAGVSPKTVSRVLNGEASVREQTRDAVNEAIASLRYVPSSAARTMRSNRSGLIGLVTGAISQSPPTQMSGLPDLFIVQGVQKALEAGGKTLLISDTGGKSDRIPGLIRTLSEHRVEGLIYVAPHHQKVTLPHMENGPRVVLANCYDDIGTPAVLPDDRQGQRRLTEELIAMGHTRIAYLTLSSGMDATRLRTLGYRDGLKSAGLPFHPNLVLAAVPQNPAAKADVPSLRDAIQAVLGLTDPPTVICVGNDLMAMRTYGILRSLGLRVPEDISVAGFDNYRQIAETLDPPLSSVELPYAAIGVRASELLLDLILGKTTDNSGPRLVAGPIHWRESVLPHSAENMKPQLIGRTST